MDRSTPIDLLPSGEEQQATEVLQEPSVKMEIRKKNSEEKDTFKLELDMESMVLIVLLFVAGYLKTTNVEFLPEMLKSNLITFSLVKSLALFAVFYLYKNWVERT
jgi:hypothetical protein